MSSEEITNRDYHDKSLQAEYKAKRLRNAIGGTAISLYITVFAISQQAKPEILQNTTSSVLIGAASGLVSAAAYGLHTKAQRKHERAVEFAAFEVSESRREGTDVPNWAATTLQKSGMSIDEVLGPRSDQ